MNDLNFIRMKFWQDIAKAYAGASNAVHKERAAEWADKVLADFDAKFPASYFEEDLTQKDVKHDAKTGGVWLTDDEVALLTGWASNSKMEVFDKLIYEARKRMNK